MSIPKDSAFSLSHQVFAMPSDTIQVRLLLRHYWREGLSVRRAVEQINHLREGATTNKSTAARWFRRFNRGDLSLRNKSRSGRPIKVDHQHFHSRPLTSARSQTYRTAGGRSRTIVLFISKNSCCFFLFEHMHKRFFFSTVFFKNE